MNCEEAKRLIKSGDAGAARDHIASCPDCAAFQADFGELAGLLESVPAPADNEMLLEKTIRLAKAELAKPVAVPAAANPARTWAAAVFAVIFAPVILAMNYGVAEAGRTFLADLLAPAFGAAFFVSYTTGALVAVALAYSSLPLLIGAAKRTLKNHAAPGRVATQY